MEAGSRNRLGYIADNTSGISTKTDDANAYLKCFTGHSKIIYSNDGAKTTVSDTRSDTEGKGINHITFITDGALSSVISTYGVFIGADAIDSSSTYTAGSVLYLNKARKVKCSTHGSMTIHLNA